jgi:E3 ubiquitin-protein ligase RNF13
MRSQRLHTNCTFDYKVRHAQQAGAAAAIVYDNAYEPLIIMSKPAGHASPGIPAVFISQKSGIIMKKLMTPGVTIAHIMPISDEVWISILMSAFSGVIAVGVMLATFYFIRRHRLRALGAHGGLTEALLRGEEEGGMSAAELRALPVVIHEPPPRRHRPSPSGGSNNDEGDIETGSTSSGDSPRGPKGGGTLKTCAVCIEDYADGDKQRVLPCQHRFHMECIDQWLSARRPLCPICKWDAAQPFPNSAEAAAQAATAQPEEPGFLTRRWRRWRWRRARRRSGVAISAALATAGSSSRAAAAPAAGAEEQHPSTPHNFPGMHFARRAASSAALAAGEEISAAPDSEGGAGAEVHDVAVDIGPPLSRRASAAQQPEAAAADAP